MEWVQLVADFLSEIAWPVVVLSVLLLFRKPLIARLGQLLEVEGPGLRAKFGQALDHAEDLKEVAAAIDDSPSVPSPVQDPLPGMNGDSPAEVTPKSDGDVLADLHESLDHPEPAQPSWLDVPAPKENWRGPLSPSERATMSGLSVDQVQLLTEGLAAAAEIADVSPKASATLAWGVLRQVVRPMMKMFDAQRVSDLIPLLRAMPVFSRSDAALLRVAEELVEYPSEAWESSDNGGPRFVRLVEYLIDRLLLVQSDRYLDVGGRQRRTNQARLLWERERLKLQRHSEPQRSDRPKP